MEEGQTDLARLRSMHLAEPQPELRDVPRARIKAGSIGRPGGFVSFKERPKAPQRLVLRTPYKKRSCLILGGIRVSPLVWRIRA